LHYPGQDQANSGGGRGLPPPAAVTGLISSAARNLCHGLHWKFDDFLLSLPTGFGGFDTHQVELQRWPAQLPDNADECGGRRTLTLKLVQPPAMIIFCQSFGGTGTQCFVAEHPSGRQPWNRRADPDWGGITSSIVWWSWTGRRTDTLPQ